jgi:hypothetical protein
MRKEECQSPEPETWSTSSSSISVTFAWSYLGSARRRASGRCSARSGPSSPLRQNGLQARVANFRGGSFFPLLQNLLAEGGRKKVHHVQLRGCRTLRAIFAATNRPALDVNRIIRVTRNGDTPTLAPGTHAESAPALERR